MDIAIFDNFSYSNEDAWNDFLLANATSHNRYNDVIQRLGLPIQSADLMDMEDTENGRNDWLMNHQLVHKALAETLGIIVIPDLTDVELNDDNQFSNWLQLHHQQHQQADYVLNV